MEAAGGNTVKRGCSILELVAILKREGGSFAKLRDLYDVLACVLGVPLAEGRVEAEECWGLLKKGRVGGELPLYLLLQQWLGKTRSDGQPPGLTVLLKALDSIGMGEGADAVRSVFCLGQKKKDDEVASISRDDVDVTEDHKDDFESLRWSFEVLKRKFLKCEEERKKLEEENSVLRGQLKIKCEALVKTESNGTEFQPPPPLVKQEVEEPPVVPLEVVNLNLSNLLSSVESPEEDAGNFGEFSSGTAVENEPQIDLKMMDDPSHPHYPFEIVVDVEESEDQSVGGSFPNTDEWSEMDMDEELRPTKTPTNTPSATKGPRLELVVSSPKGPRLKTSQFTGDLEVQKSAGEVFPDENEEEGQQKSLVEMGKACSDFSVASSGESVRSAESKTEFDEVAPSPTATTTTTEPEPKASYNLRRRCSAGLRSYDSDTENMDKPAEDEVKNKDDFESALAEPPSGKRILFRVPGSLRRQSSRQQSLIKTALATARSKPKTGAHSSALVKLRNSSQDEASAATNSTAKSHAASEARKSKKGEGEYDSSQEKRKRHPKGIPDHITIVEVSGELELPIYQCKICKGKFELKNSIGYHKFCGTERKPFKCETCDKGFTFKSQYVEHQTTHTGVKPHVCSKCKKGFSRRGTLIQHMRSHSGENPHVCLVCKRGFSTAQALRVHTLTHTGEQPFPCTHCDKRFSQKKHLNQHFITHTGERRFSCTHCGKSFGLKQNLDIHLLRMHSKKRPHACDQCTKTFGTSSDLRRHRLVHSGVKPFQCEICQSSFKQKCDLNRHFKKKHNQSKQGTSVNEEVA